MRAQLWAGPQAGCFKLQTVSLCLWAPGQEKENPRQCPPPRATKRPLAQAPPPPGGGGEPGGGGRGGECSQTRRPCEALRAFPSGPLPQGPAAAPPHGDSGPCRARGRGSSQGWVRAREGARAPGTPQLPPAPPPPRRRACGGTQGLSPAKFQAGGKGTRETGNRPWDRMEPEQDPPLGLFPLPRSPASGVSVSANSAPASDNLRGVSPPGGALFLPSQRSPGCVGSQLPSFQAPVGRVRPPPSTSSALAAGSARLNS